MEIFISPQETAISAHHRNIARLSRPLTPAEAPAFRAGKASRSGKRRSENSGKCSRSRNIVSTSTFLHVSLSLLPYSILPFFFLQEKRLGCLKRICRSRVRVRVSSSSCRFCATGRNENVLGGFSGGILIIF